MKSEYPKYFITLAKYLDDAVWIVDNKTSIIKIFRSKSRKANYMTENYLKNSGNFKEIPAHEAAFLI